MSHSQSPHDEALFERLGRPVRRRIAVLGALLILPAFLAWWCAPMLGVRGNVRGLLTVSFPLVVMVGYQLWWTRILAVATGAFGRRLSRALMRLAVRRTSTEGRTQLRPTREDARQLGSRALAATSVFRTVARIAGVVVGLAVGFAATWWAAMLVTVALVAWGQWLAALGADGWLPLPEGD
jgi:hypothetical protein